MTREEAQALAEELVTQTCRSGRWLEWEEAGNSFCQGIQAFALGVQSEEPMHTSSLVLLASTVLELLREAFLQTGESAEAIRAEHHRKIHGEEQVN